MGIKSSGGLMSRLIMVRTHLCMDRSVEGKDQCRGSERALGTSRVCVEDLVE